MCQSSMQRAPRSPTCPKRFRWARHTRTYLSSLAALGEHFVRRTYVRANLSLRASRRSPPSCGSFASCFPYQRATGDHAPSPTQDSKDPLRARAHSRTFTVNLVGFLLDGLSLTAPVLAGPIDIVGLFWGFP